MPKIQTNILILHKTNELSISCFLHLYCTHLIMKIFLILLRNGLQFNKHFHDIIIISLNIKASKFFVYTKLFIVTHICSKLFFCQVFQFFWISKTLWDFVSNIQSQIDCHWWVVHFIGTNCRVWCSCRCGVLPIHHLLLNLSLHFSGMVGTYSLPPICGNIIGQH